MTGAVPQVGVSAGGVPNHGVGCGDVTVGGLAGDGRRHSQFHGVPKNLTTRELRLPCDKLSVYGNGIHDARAMKSDPSPGVRDLS
jgi:hypothetical protein